MNRNHFYQTLLLHLLRSTCDFPFIPFMKHTGRVPALQRALLLEGAQCVTPSPVQCVGLTAAVLSGSLGLSPQTGGRPSRVSSRCPHLSLQVWSSTGAQGVAVVPQFLGRFAGEAPWAPEPRFDLGHLLVTSPPPACGLNQVPPLTTTM